MIKNEIYPDYMKAHELLADSCNYQQSLDEFVKQGRHLQKLLYSETNKAGWNVEGIIDMFINEYLFLNNGELNIDWYFQCFFIWQRLKGEYDKRQARTGAIRTAKIHRLEDEIYKVFIKGIEESKVKFMRSDEVPNLPIPTFAVRCHDFYWWIVC